MENEVKITVKVDNKTSAGFNDVQRGLSRLGTIGEQVGEAIAGSLAQAGEEAGGFVSRMASGTASVAALGGEATAATGGLNVLVGGLMAAAGAAGIALAGFTVLAPALYAIGGAAAAAMTGLAGIGATIGVLKIGLGGIGDAFSAFGKQQGGGGGGGGAAAAKAQAQAVSAATDQVRNAMRSLVDAQRAAKQASEDVSRAREEEILRLRDLRLALRGATLDQRDALAELTAAKINMSNQLALGLTAPDKIADLQEKIDRAQLSYEGATNKISDLTKEQTKADKVGVDGSDRVKAALEQQRAAQERVTVSTEQLAQAHKRLTEAAAGSGGGGGAAGGVNLFKQAMDKLSPTARQVVYALIDVSRRFDVIKRQVQDRLLADFPDVIRDLADKWLPKLGPMLGGIADHLNHMGKAFASALGNSTFINNIGKALHGFGGFIDQLGTAGSAFLDTFGRLAAAGVPVLKVIGRIIDDIFVSFGNWIKEADRSGAMTTFMKRAADTLWQIYDIGKLAVKIIGQIVAILFPGSDKAGASLLDSMEHGLQSVSNWLKDPKNQQKLIDFIKKLGDFIATVITGVIPALVSFGDKVKTTYEGFKVVSDKISKTWHFWVDPAKAAFKQVKDAALDVISWFHGMPSRLYGALHGAWDGLKDGFRAALNWVIGKWNNLSFTFPAVDFLGMHLGGGSINTPNIPYLASGGIAGGLAMVGERGKELVRLPHGSQVYSHGDSERMLAGGQGGGNLRISIDTAHATGLARALLEMLRLEVRGQGGNVQQVLGVAGR